MQADLAEQDLAALQRDHPDEWTRVRARVLRASEEGPAAVRALIGEHVARQAGPADRLRSEAQRRSEAVERRMLQQLLGAMSDRAESGTWSGPIRLGRWSGTLLQAALFRRGLDRKPVRLAAFRVAWRLASGRARLMPLVRERGVYCFVTTGFVRDLARIARGRRTVEIAAGDGTLARFLIAAGAPVTASDDGSWAHRIDIPADVERIDARAVLRRDRPEVVVCCWPPAGNRFEAAVFATPSVRTYVAVLSADPHEAGAPEAYAAQRDFDVREDERLSRLVLPPGRNRVLVFTRRAAVSR